MSEHDHDHGFLPGAGHRLLTPVYDVLARLSGSRRLHVRLVDLARIDPGHLVLDLGTGTGAVALRAAMQHPDATVVGVDPDPQMLDQARAKPAPANVTFAHGFAEDLPFPDGEFDRVLSSLALHHIESTSVEQAVAEIRRVLRPGGLVLIADFPPTRTHGHGPLSRLLHRTGAVPEVHGVDVAAHLRTAGFTDVTAIADEQLRFMGTVGFTRATA